MSVLETIRKRAKLLVGIIGASLAIFVLEDALNSGRGCTGGGANTIAIINGKSIDYTKFRGIAEDAVNKQKESMGTAAQNLRDSDQNVAVQSAFKNMVFHAILDPEYQKLGINVSDSELVDLTIGSHPAPDIYRLFSNGHGGLNKNFVDPRTGGLNMANVVRYVKAMNPQESARWDMIEEKIKNEDLQDKYFYLLINGLYLPDAIAKKANEDETKTFDISYVLKRYTDVPDNSVTVNDQDIKDYYNKHIYEFNQQEETRRVDYVTFTVSPSDTDMINIKRDVDTMYAQYKRLPAKEDSAFVVASDAGYFDYEYHKAGDLPVTIDSIMTHAEVGAMYGPYKEDNRYKIAKLIDIAELPDSIKYSQIFIPVQNAGEADKVKAFVDSLKKIATPENFAELAKANSKDPESVGKGGDMGWIGRGGKGEQFPPYLEHQVFFGKTGNVIELPIQQGIILICVMEQSERHTNYQVGVAVKNIDPSKDTRDRVYAQASDFDGKNRTGDLFEKSVSQMNRRVLDLGENETSLAGMESPKEFVRWAYEKKEGDVSDVLNVGENKLIVAHIMQVTKMGTIPLEQVKEQVKLKVIDEKKAEKIMADMKAALSGGSLASVGQKMGSAPATAQGLTFSSYSIPSLGKEDAVIGTMSAMNTGAISQPIQGSLGVFVIKVDSAYYGRRIDFHATQMQDQESMRRAAPNEAYNALVKKAGFVSHLGKYY